MQTQVLWTHNDSSNYHEVIAIDAASGEVIEQFELYNAANFDYEDMAIGPGPEEGAFYLYVGDVGDNNYSRKNYAVYRVKEPNLQEHDGNVIAQSEWEKLTLYYPDQEHDVECLLVDPWTKMIYLITKESNTIWRTNEAWGEGDAVMELVKNGQVNKEEVRTKAKITGGDISRDGREILLKYYDYVVYICRDEGESISDALSRKPGMRLPYISEPQGESVAFASELMGGYYTLSESQGRDLVPLYHYSRLGSYR